MRKRLTEDGQMALRIVSLCEAILHLAVDGGMPDSYWDSDSRIELARSTLAAQIGVGPARKIEKQIREGETEFAVPVFEP